MKVVVDTNLVFSSILNTDSKIAKILLQSANLRFYSCFFLKSELRAIYPKLKQLTALTNDEISELEGLVTKPITFINEEVIPADCLNLAIELTKGIYSSDTPFVALAIHLKAKLWSGDKRLLQGLKHKGYEEVVSTQDMIKIISTKRVRKTNK